MQFILCNIACFAPKNYFKLCGYILWIYTVSSTVHTLATKAVRIYYYTVSSTEHTLATCTKAVWIYYTVSSTEHTLATKSCVDTVIVVQNTH